MTKLLSLLLFCSIAMQIHAQKARYKTAIASFYNLENFYDTLDNPNINDDDFTPAGSKHYTRSVYEDKVTHMATVVSQIGSDMNPDGPSILGVSEIENDTVLNDLIHHPLLQNRHYKMVHYDSKDIRGVDVALLYNPKYFTVLYSKKLFVRLPFGAKESVFTRDILWVKGLLDGDTVHILVNHWPSRVGGEQRSMPGRFAAAEVDKKLIDSIQYYEPNAKVIVMGDLNDDPISPSVTKVLEAKADVNHLAKGDLYNPWVAFYKQGLGTLAYNDAWGLFDQIIINNNWLPKNQNGYFLLAPYIFHKEFMIENIGRYKGYPMRTWDGNTYRGGYSDHFPTYLVFVKKID